VAALAWAAACGGAGDAASRDPDTAPGGDSVASAMVPPDSLILRIPGATVWHTLSREAMDSSGGACLERTLEIRPDAGRPVRVPLLYTRDVPVVVDDSTLEARVYRDCRPGDRYRVDLRTGQPTPVR